MFEQFMAYRIPVYFFIDGTVLKHLLEFWVNKPITHQRTVPVYTVFGWASNCENIRNTVHTKH